MIKHKKAVIICVVDGLKKEDFIQEYKDSSVFENLKIVNFEYQYDYIPYQNCINIAKLRKEYDIIFIDPIEILLQELIRLNFNFYIVYPAPGRYLEFRNMYYECCTDTRLVRLFDTAWVPMINNIKKIICENILSDDVQNIYPIELPMGKFLSDVFSIYLSTDKTYRVGIDLESLNK